MGTAYAKGPDPETSRVAGVRLLVQRSGGELAAACVFVGVGSSHEDPGNNGITSLLNNMVISASPFAGSGSPSLEIERLGGTVGVETKAEYSVFTVVAPVGKLAASLKALGAALARPPLDNTTLKAEKRHLNCISRLGSDVPVELGYRLLLEKAYPEVTGSMYPDGSPETVRTISVEDLKAWHGIHYTRDNIIVSVCANMDMDSAIKALQSEFGITAGTGRAEESHPRDKDPVQATPLRGHGYTCPTLSGSVALVGYDAPPPGSSDYPAFKLAEAVVALGMGSKLFGSLRVYDKLSYSFGSILPPTLTGPRLAFYVNADPSRIDDAVDRVVRAVDSLKRGELTDTELERARGKATGKLYMEGDGVESKARRQGLAVALGLEPGYWEHLAERLGGIGSKDVARVARKYMDSHTLVVIRPGDGGV